MKSTGLILAILLFCFGINAILAYNSDDISSFVPTRWPDKVLDKIKEKRAYIQLMMGQSIQDDTTKCAVCDLLIFAIIEEKNFDMTAIQLTAEGEYFCQILGVANSVCEGIIGMNIDPLYYIADNANVSSQEICSMLLDCDTGKDNFEWTIDIPDGSTVDKIISDGESTIKIGHITDIHYDPNYTVGKSLSCGEPLCCQSDQENAKNDSDACGYYSSENNADVSLQLVESALDEMARNKYDYIYFTGDLVSHRVWGTSHEFNTKIITTIMEMFAKKFENTPVFPVLGNHESHPVNVYAPIEIKDDEISISWLYDLILDKWSKWLSSDTVKETILKGGYYTVKVKNGFRVIVLNNNVCSTENWWNLYNNNDPYGELKWLVTTLVEAEKNKEVVHILYHIPTSSCLKSWGREYNKILNRFSNTVAAQFNGHSHRDQFYIHYNSDNNPIGVTFNGGSLIPDLANPNFKVYTVDAKGYDVLDSETYTFDLSTANHKKSIDWRKLYSFREAFGVKNLTASELDNLVFKKLKENITLVQNYHDYYFRDSTTGKKDCNEDCKTKYLCEIITTQRGVSLCNLL